MNALFEILPLIVFFVVFKLKGIYIATGALMVITILQSIFIYFKFKKLTVMQIVTLVLVVAFGAVTLIFHDDIYMKFKPTALYWGFAVALEISWRTYKTNLAQKILKPMLEKSDIYINNSKIWLKTHHFCAAFFWALGLLNIIIAYRYSIDVWINVKVWVLPILSFIGIFSLAFWLNKHNEIKSDKEQSIE